MTDMNVDHLIGASHMRMLQMSSARTCLASKEPMDAAQLKRNGVGNLELRSSVTTGTGTVPVTSTSRTLSPASHNHVIP